MAKRDLLVSILMLIASGVEAQTRHQVTFSQQYNASRLSEIYMYRDSGRWGICTHRLVDENCTSHFSLVNSYTYIETYINIGIFFINPNNEMNFTYVFLCKNKACRFYPMGESVYIGDIYDSDEYIIVRYIRYDGGGEKECYLSINENEYKISRICFWRDILFPGYNYESWSSFRFSNNNMIINIRTKENGKNQRKFTCRHINGIFDCDDDNFYAYIENNENF